MVRRKRSINRDIELPVAIHDVRDVRVYVALARSYYTSNPGLVSLEFGNVCIAVYLSARISLFKCVSLTLFTCRIPDIFWVAQLLPVHHGFCIFPIQKRFIW